MLTRILPTRADNSYRGTKIALWLLGALVLLRTIMSVNMIFNGYAVASGPDAIPLNTYPADAARAIVALFGLLGIASLGISIFGIVVLVRYRSLVPLMFVIMLLQHLAGRLRDFLMPIPRTSAVQAGYINLILLTLMVAGFVLSLAGVRDVDDRALSNRYSG